MSPNPYTALKVSRDHSTLIDLPSSPELFGVFNQFLINWLNCACEYVISPMEDHSVLPLEQSVLFSKPFGGLMVVRSQLGFEKFLTELATGKKTTKGIQKNGWFLAMTVLFWHLLVSQKWGMDSRKLPAALLKPTVPLDWPDRKPDSACTVFIKGFPVEIRLWNNLGPGEIKAWE